MDARYEGRTALLRDRLEQEYAWMGNRIRVSGDPWDFWVRADSAHPNAAEELRDRIYQYNQTYNAGFTGAGTDADAHEELYSKMEESIDRAFDGAPERQARGEFAYYTLRASYGQSLPHGAYEGRELRPMRNVINAFSMLEAPERASLRQRAGKDDAPEINDYLNQRLDAAQARGTDAYQAECQTILRELTFPGAHGGNHLILIPGGIMDRLRGEAPAVANVAQAEILQAWVGRGGADHPTVTIPAIADRSMGVFVRNGGITRADALVPAIRAFQQENGLPVNGTLDAATAGRLTQWGSQHEAAVEAVRGGNARPRTTGLDQSGSPQNDPDNSQQSNSSDPRNVAGSGWQHNATVGAAETGTGGATYQIAAGNTLADFARALLQKPEYRQALTGLGDTPEQQVWAMTMILARKNDMTTVNDRLTVGERITVPTTEEVTAGAAILQQAGKLGADHGVTWAEASRADVNAQLPSLTVTTPVVTQR